MYLSPCQQHQTQLKKPHTGRTARVSACGRFVVSALHQRESGTAQCAEGDRTRQGEMASAPGAAAVGLRRACTCKHACVRSAQKRQREEQREFRRRQLALAEAEDELLEADSEGEVLLMSAREQIVALTQQRVLEAMEKEACREVMAALKLREKVEGWMEDFEDVQRKRYENLDSELRLAKEDDILVDLCIQTDTKQDMRLEENSDDNLDLGEMEDSSSDEEGEVC